MRRAPSPIQFPSSLTRRASSPMDHPSSSTRRAPSPIQFPSSSTRRAPSPIQFPSSSTRRAPSPIQFPSSSTRRAPSPIQFPSSSTRRAPRPIRYSSNSMQHAPSPIQQDSVLTEEAGNDERGSIKTLLIKRSYLRQQLAAVDREDSDVDFSPDDGDGGDLEGAFDLRQRLSSSLEVGKEENGANFNLEDGDGGDFEGVFDLRQRLASSVEVGEAENSAKFILEDDDGGDSESVFDLTQRLANRTRRAHKDTQPHSDHRDGALEQEVVMEGDRSERHRGCSSFIGNNRGRPSGRKRRMSCDRQGGVEREQPERPHSLKRQKLSKGNSRRFQGCLPRYQERQQEVKQQGTHPAQSSRKVNTTHPRGCISSIASHLQDELEETQRRWGSRGIRNDDPIRKFLRKVYDIPFESSPDTLCMFLAQHQNHLAQALVGHCLQNREVTDKLLAMLRKALSESALCNSSGQQVMKMLKATGFFESGLAIAIVKSLVATEHRHPDESDVIVADNMLEVMNKLLDARILATKDTIVFIGSLQVALRTSIGGADGREDILDLKNKVQAIECKVGHPHTNANCCDMTTDADDTMIDPLGPILPDISRTPITDLQPRNVLDTFSSATEYVLYMFQVYREDFIGPLYEGVQDYMSYTASGKRKGGRKKPKFRNQNVRLYENVQIVDTALSSDTGIDVTVRIDIRSSFFRNFHSRLIYGSLVCLSCDNFQNVIYATVSDRDPKVLQTQGLLNIHILRNEHDHRYDNSDFINEDLNGKDGDRQKLPNGMGDKLSAIIGTSVNLSGNGESRTVGDVRFVMLESTVYYTAYMHTLQSLKALYFRVSRRQDTLPFKRQLLELNKESRTPRCHEASDGHLSFTCMMKYAEKAVQAAVAAVPENDVHKETDETNKEEPNNSVRKYRLTSSRYSPASPVYVPTSPSYLPASPTSLYYLGGISPLGMLSENEFKNLKRKRKIVKEKFKNNTVGQPSSWPSAELLGLDDSQYNALKMALTHNIALIQGPPGTGKTLLGLRIAELLLNNQHLWRTGDDEMMSEAPLLLLSYTNHALDQFLTAILKSPCARNYATSDVVRVGSRCEHEGLAVHNITRLRKMEIDQLDNEKMCLEQLRKFRNSIDTCLDISKHKIIHLHDLRQRQVICEHHAKSLSERSNSPFPTFLKWLCPDNDNLNISLCNRPSPLAGTADVESNNAVHVIEGYDVGSCEQELEMEEEYKRQVDLDEGSDDESQPTLINSGDLKLQNMKLSDVIEEQHFLPRARELMFYDLTAHCPSKVTAMHRKIEQEANLVDFMTEREEEDVRDVWRLAVPRRWRLYRLWLKRVRDQIRHQRDTDEEIFNTTSERVKERRSLTDLNIIRRAQVVAMTTTGAARYSSVLRELGPRVVIVEEAAQVPEAHIISALSSSCDHLIMIGDHQQLRPSCNNYSLTLNCNQHFIDISLFERLCHAGLPFSRLVLQHRMRPEISRLLVPTIYKHLKDDISVLDCPNVRGVKANMFFLNHSYLENSSKESKSKRNLHEAEFLKSLYRYLRLQGYSEKDITVLALYRDQVILLKTLIKKVEQEDPLIRRQKDVPSFSDDIPTRYGRRRPKPKPSGAHVTAVDNFQGEESKVVLLSLVRSNEEGRIGYLGEANRVCVALSRAKEGLYVIGNCTMLGDKSPKCWKPILQIAKDSGLLGEKLPLHCSRHDIVTHVKTSTDIDQCFNGGCTSRCDFRLRCGHCCEQICHDPILFHDNPCEKPCARQCSFGHRCSSSCSEYPCPPCKEPCWRKCQYGHVCDKECGRECAPCQSRCEKKLRCGHQCQSKCGLLCTVDCKELVKVTGVCGHEFQTACFMKDSASCTVPCAAQLNCGHPCSGKCGMCFAGRLHVSCRKDCQRVLICGHTCTAKCAKSCPPCQRPCGSRCMHSGCKKKCGELCTPCIDPCTWHCKQRCPNKFHCDKLCSEVCDRLRCDEPCPSQHQCGKCKILYKCRGLLCESSKKRPCPAACPSCNKDIFDIFFGSEDEPDARFYQMPDCDCVLEVSGLDQYMDMDSENVGNKTCPKCKSPVLKAQRYRQVLNKTADTVKKVKRRLLKEVGSDDTKHKVNEAVKDLETKFNQSHRSINMARLSTDLKRLADQVKNYLCILMKWTQEKRFFFSEQELEEFQRELTRGDIIINLLATQHHLIKLAAVTPEKERLLEMVQRFIDRVLQDVKVLSPEEVKDIRQSIKDANSLSGLGVSDEERVMILRAMDFSKGHWYKCRNGHVYCIGECGGAMEESVCPECKEKVGGGQHRLADGNAVATEMDGARYGAWSEQANLANYENLADL